MTSQTVPASRPSPPATIETPNGGAAPSDLQRRQQLQERILISGDLPTLPTIALEVSRLAANPLTGMSEIVRIIRNDPPLTGKILRVANSAFYGMSRRIESLNMALVVLGIREVNNLVTSIAVIRMFPWSPTESNFDRRAFWEHSAGCGELARVIATRLHLRLHGVEFTAGLLHDIGKILLDQYAHKEFMSALDLSMRQKTPLSDAERAVFGTDHGELGAWLAERWSLPPAIVEAIHYHHQPASSSDNAPLAAVIHLADLFSKMLLDASASRAELHDQLTRDSAWDILAQQNPEVMAMDITRFIAELEESAERARELVKLAHE